MDWFARWARDTPDAPYLIAGSEVVDFAAAHERITAVAAALRRSWPVGSRLGAVMTPDVPSVLAALAVPAAGMTLVALPAGGSEAERLRLADLAGVETIVPGIHVQHGAGGPRFEPDAGAVCAAIFTSGTTGLPRAVRLTWGNIEASAAASAAHLEHRADDRWLAVLPLHHVGGLSILWRSARQGSAVVLGGRFEPVRIRRLLEEGSVTLASFVSPMVESLADAGLRRVPGFRLGLVGGGPVSQRALSETGLRLLPTYGMTETASQVATADPADPRPDRLVVLDGVEIVIRDDGRIVVDGPMVSPGDLDAADRTGPLVTGDVGRMHGHLLEVLGRADDVIVTGGENVMPERVEQALERISGAGTVAVVGIRDERWGAVVGAAYTGSADPADLAFLARQVLGSHEIPRRWVRVDEIPRLGIGKIDRRAVARLFD